ncbi:MAG: hypothetical protein A3F15_03005 [Candidatus Wildermuthbacteria bacterium RIFCSPHIGHO2_12_FULL_40_12]|uniref:Uncharacterized protein n=1 Tax=Candidatus Wildermuthbacteria bacterium RIFCSPHIGHO2_12_FULL_40_12 TaxID=1802457 RepID=A0A1G2RET9_9BACT|nr:MAG: hypothetical protein A3F15_03005 [Candidatus Wildermuthbacteria bacterium RIFCSPHIGHO2_12_FULL_40_12]
MVLNILDYTDTGFGSPDLDRRRIRLLPSIFYHKKKIPYTEAGDTKAKSKVQRIQKVKATKAQALIGGDESGIIRVPAIAEPAVAPAPGAATPAEATDTQIAIRVMVDSSPEEDIFPLPFFWDKVGVLQKVIKKVSVENRFSFELLAKLITLDNLTILLVRGKIEFDFFGTPLKLSSLDVLLDLPSVWNERTDIEVDEMLDLSDFGKSMKNSS